MTAILKTMSWNRLLYPLSPSFLLLAGLLLALAACQDRPKSVEPPSDGPSGSWPQWRGPQRDGTASSQGLLATWDDGQPHELWRHPLGEGLGGIAIADGKAVVLAAQGHDEFLVALDARLGSELWRTPLGPTFLDGHGNGPRTTPVIDQGRVYALASRRVLAADLASGKVLWQQALAEPPEWGFSSSPLLVDGKLIVHGALGADPATAPNTIADDSGQTQLRDDGTVEADSADPQDAVVHALDAQNGQWLWSAGSGHPGYASPLVGELAGKRQIISFVGQGLIGLDIATGRRLWMHRWATSYNVNAADPVLLPNDRIFISSGYHSGAALLEIGTTDDPETLAVREVWTSRSMKNHFSSSVAVGSYLYGFDNATFKCISADDGQTLWRERGFGKGSLIVADGKLVVLTGDGTLVLVEPTPDSYRELGRVSVLRGDSWTPPSLAGQWLYLRDHQDLVCLQLGT